MAGVRCTHSGAEFPSKKRSVLTQNPENKGPEIFLPRRSMVLKVVRGKIFTTLELACLPGRLRLRSLDKQQSAGRRFSPSSCWSDSAVGDGQELRPFQVVKERCYLGDNLCSSIISLIRE
jgi:hypothetical protein